MYHWISNDLGVIKMYHIKNVKDVAKQAQQHAAVIDRQTGERLYERHVLEVGYYFVRELKMAPCSPADESIHSATKGTVVFACAPHVGSHIEAWLEWKRKRNSPLELFRHDDIISLLIQKYWAEAMIFNDGSRELRIPLFTKYRRRDEIYCAHSDYRSGGPWYDWCVVQWDVREEF